MTGFATFANTKRGLTANGLSPVLFRRVFKKDFLTARIEAQKANGGMVELYGEMAFIMAMQYDGGDLSKLTENDYFEWLAGLNAADIENNVDVIHAIYEGNEVSLSDPKDAPR